MTAVLPLVIGDQRLRGPQTGVATYSGLMADALGAVGRPHLTIDTSPLDASLSRIGRWARATRLRPRRAHRAGSALLLPDIFREAQVYFDIWRRPLAIECDGPPGIVHWTYPVPLRIAGWKNIYTFHDLIPILHPHLSPIRAPRYRRMLNMLLSHAARIVTVSAASRGDIERIFGTPTGFVVDCGEAVRAEPETGVSLPDGLTQGGFLLHCGTIEPRKNVARLIKAWSASCCGLPLVLAGAAGWRSEGLLAQAARAGALHMNYVPRKTMIALMAGARALLMPSLAEGFGLPVAEAMVLGTPVLTSHAHALAETAGGAALLVDPTDTMALTVAIRRVATDDLLCNRLRRAGIARGATFSIEAFGRRLVALYNEMEHHG